MAMEFGLISWNADKNHLLRETRGVCFEDVENAIEQNAVLDDYPHPDGENYPHQRILVVAIRGYACNTPYVFEEDGIFLKTIYPSRKATRLFLNRGEHDK